uniref:Uncharacterized protein n=1 Tax=Arundo donax TaxID=35708 RepID=A0A0A9AL93_ARUDO
MRCCPSRC